ncbi:LysM peptidoglycan-binding domain-containing protein [Chryseobacterium oryctis]|uniref:LysM peptidoglycan-binding domain-containing protein n=1 Tax=Chryseobacterium oryctis TaxID=2952618 RepID=A0ABT3HP50_9FLAO|nr:LysM domain-containing protein [Chryseobacterium oryctis]MCW3161470.1 LysM peptidoglycan-binding domain-containing protein [Chryseobacterium oryctis]
MSISISTYQVKAGDTLESVAEQLGISTEYLKRYHNTYCDLKNLIGTNLIGIHEIMLPPREKIAEFKENQKQISARSNLPSVYLNKDFYAYNYEASERFEQAGKEDLKVNYLVSIKSQELKDKGFVVEMKTSEFEKQDESPDDKISMLSLACMESISPVAFSVPAQGKIKGFYDYQALVKKFESKRPDLESFFVGEINKNYIDKFGTSIKNEEYLLKQFCSSLLYQVLFPEMDWFRRQKEWEGKFYVIPNSFSVKCRFHTEHNFESSDDVEIFIGGKIEDDCSLQELLKGVKLEEPSENTITGEIELRYTTSKETKRLKKIEASIILLHQEELYLKHDLTLTEKEEKKIRKFSTLVEE